MSLSIAGMSWITPLGSGVADVWKRLVAGEAAPVETLENEQNGARYLVRRVPATLTAHLPPHPRAAAEPRRSGGPRHRGRSRQHDG